MTIAEKLQTIIDIKSDIKGAIIEKGVSVTDSDSFASYADKIRNIETGGSSGGSGDDTLSQLFLKTLSSYDIPYGATEIKPYLFSGCSNLTSITIPDSVESIEDYAFYECSNLTSITIPDSVESIGIRGFANCSTLSNITLPDSELTINNYAFRETNIESIYLHENINLKVEVFYKCENLKSAEVYCNLTQETFENCTNLQKVWLPSTVDKVTGGSYSVSPFYGCLSSCTVYTDIASEYDIPSNWGAYWNYRSTSGKVKVVYGATYEEYQNVPVTTALNVDTEDEVTSEDVMPEDVDNE